MATIIEPGLIGSERIKRVCYLTGLDEDAVLGKLLRLWESSQALKMVSASSDQIGFWLRAPSKEKGAEWVTAWADKLAGFLFLQEDGSYYIQGNAKHIEKKTAMSEANRKRALRRWQPQDEAETMPSESRRHADGMRVNVPPDAASNAYTILDSTVLNSTELNTTSASSDDSLKSAFEEIYKLYPKRKGDQRKSHGLKYCARHFKSTEAIEKLRLAVQNYARFCEAEKKTGTEYVQQFGTFVNGRWEEWLEARTKAPGIAVRRLEALP